MRTASGSRRQARFTVHTGSIGFAERLVPAIALAKTASSVDAEAVGVGAAVIRWAVQPILLAHAERSAVWGWQGCRCWSCSWGGCSWSFNQELTNRRSWMILPKKFWYHSIQWSMMDV